MDEAEAHRSTEELRQLTRGALAEMRTLLFELRPAALNQARLPDLLKQLSEAVMGRKRLPIRLDIVGDCEIPCDVKVEMYRIVQESLNNVVKYARATQVEIKVLLEAARVYLEITDNGTGFDAASVKPTSLGLRIMRERAEAINAQLRSSASLAQAQRSAWNGKLTKNQPCTILKFASKGRSIQTGRSGLESCTCRRIPAMRPSSAENYPIWQRFMELFLASVAS